MTDENGYWIFGDEGGDWKHYANIGRTEPFKLCQRGEDGLCTQCGLPIAEKTRRQCKPGQKPHLPMKDARIAPPSRTFKPLGPNRPVISTAKRCCGG